MNLPKGKVPLTYRTWKKGRWRVVYVKELISGRESYLKPIKFHPVNRLGYVVFFDTRINRYIIYKFNKVFHSVKGLDSNWLGIDNENRKALGKYSKILVCEGPAKTYRPLGYWIVETITKNMVIKSLNSRKDLQDWVTNLDKPTEAEVDHARKMSEIFYEMYEDIGKHVRGRVISSGDNNPNLHKNMRRKRVNVFIGIKTGKVLDESSIRRNI